MKTIPEMERKAFVSSFQPGVGKHWAWGSVLCGCMLWGFSSHAAEFNLQTLTIETQTGSNLGSSTANVDMTEFFKAQKQAVYHILSRVGIARESLTPEMQEIIDKPQTTNYQALVAFSSGLDQLDKDQYDKAKVFFEQAMQLDPKFTLARNLVEAMPAANQTLQNSISGAVSPGFTTE